MQGRRALVIDRIDLRSAIEEQLRDGFLVFFRGEMERCVPFEVGCLDRCAAVEKDGRHGIASPSRRNVQRGLTFPIRDGGRKPPVEQAVNLIEVPLFRREQEVIGGWAAGDEEDEAESRTIFAEHPHPH